MGQQYGVIDVKTATGFTKAQSNEHLRNYAKGAEEAGVSGNLDRTRIHLNFEVGKGAVIKEVDKSRSIPQRIKEIEQSRGIVNPNIDKAEDDPYRYNTVANIIIMGSHDQMMKLAFGDQVVEEKYLDNDGQLVRPDNSLVERQRDIELWAKDMYRFIARKYGEDNIAAFVVHLDETTPHIHCTLLPIAMVKGKERYSFAKTFNAKNKYEAKVAFRNLHTEMAQVNAKWGLERGLDVRLTNNKHRSTEEYRTWLRIINSELEEEVKARVKDINELDGKAKQIETKIKGLSTMLANLEAKHLNAEAELAELEALTQEGKYNNEELERRLNAKREEIKILDEKIDLRREQINTALSELEELGDEQLSLRKECERLDEQVKQKTTTADEQALRFMHSVAWEQAGMEARYKSDRVQAFADSLPQEYREKFDELWRGSIFEDLTERADELIGVATAIFMGMPEQALAYAQSHGGGSGGGETGG